jgi:hypothetical protein
MPFPPYQDDPRVEASEGRLAELHLYSGAYCNRRCAFCCVYGSPDAEYQPYTEAVLDYAAQIVDLRGSIKFYGGEPTLQTDNLIWAMAYLRDRGFRGVFTIFSNGVRAGELIRALGSDNNCRAALNYSILMGRGEEPPPAGAMERLSEYAEAHPGKLFLAHEGIHPVGRGPEFLGSQGLEDPDARCYRCYPTLTTSGQLHACPFAVELRAPHYDLGTLQTPPAEGTTAFGRFQGWIESELEPRARQKGVHPCVECTRGLAPPAYER